ncbi:protein FAM151A [Thalassophryne amazonica]|uniref:protein FAM151A n=1 Tax=Thalassophryne amazonica TaxID=390379 RepID=UPI001470936B|nr:protein FAM151A [Thalassophryne amazonica]
MLNFLVQMGDIGAPDGLLATWYHRANTKEEMTQALASDAMILEADVTVEGYGTALEKPIPIMAHPPHIYSDNTLDQWLDSVLNSRKGIKLDFKAIESVGVSLDLLNAKNRSKGINRPLWLNADIVRGPGAKLLQPVNGTRFLQLIQETFPDVTLSPGWKVIYLPPPLTETYTRSMVVDMYDMIKDVRQRVTFPVHALLVRSSWQHLSWLLSQSPRFSLTLWQGSVHPSISDLLFVRDNTHPARVYYDIYEPTLSAFKTAAKKQGRLRSFYPGGDLMDFFYPSYQSDSLLPEHINQSSLSVQWFTVTDRASTLAKLSDSAGGMLVVRVISDHQQFGVPLMEASGRSPELLTLQDVLQLLGGTAHSAWGLYLRVQTQQVLESSLKLLHSAYTQEKLYRPVWISMDHFQGSNTTEEFVSTVERLFPYVTLVLTADVWPPLNPAAFQSLSQRVALHLNADLLLTKREELDSLMGMMARYDLIMEKDRTEQETKSHEVILKTLMMTRKKKTNTNLYVISDQSAAS